MKCKKVEITVFNVLDRMIKYRGLGVIGVDWDWDFQRIIKQKKKAAKFPEEKEKENPIIKIIIINKIYFY